MSNPRTVRRAIKQPQRQQPQRLSWLALYLIFLNILCLGMAASLYLPQPTAPVQVMQPTVAAQGGPVALAVAGDPAPPPAQLPAPPTATPSGPLQAGPVPILMYHYVRTVDPALDSLGYALSVAPATFEAHLAWLRENGYSTVSMATAQRCIQGEAACPPKALVLTFDDGYLDAYTEALPALQRYGFVGTFYIVNSFVGQPGYMSWQQVAELHEAGMEIGAHTLDHPDLTVIDQAEAHRQIAQSKLDIEARLGFQVNSFCYPAGRYTTDTIALVREAGYANATTTRWDEDYGDPLAYPRRRVQGGKGVETFAAVVRGW
ncbi:MAG: polysaccharide deacetylase family protein [Roseiflexaceae bacterium]|nr:polysaccharide deacetylase family protein [Roseiflexaceae bacterium]